MLGSSSRVDAGALHSHPRHATTRSGGAAAHVMASQTIVQLEAAAAATTAEAEPNVGRSDGGSPACIQASSEAGSRTAATTSGGHLGIQVGAEAEVQAQKVKGAAAAGGRGGWRQAEAALCARQRGQIQGGLGAAGTGARQLVGHQVQEGDQLVGGRLIDPPGVLHLGDLPPELVQLLLQGAVPSGPILCPLQLLR